jgi:regulator of replication initiation timing
MLGDTNTDISAIPYHLRYKTDENKHRWILLEEAKTCIASATRDLKETLDSERSNERLKINAVQGHEELLHNLGQCNHEIDRLTMEAHAYRMEIERLNKRFKLLQHASINMTDGTFGTQNITLIGDGLREALWDDKQ